MTHTDGVTRLICGMPKAELHVQIEGTLEPELMFTLARRNHVFTSFQSVDDVRRAYKFHDRESFLQIYFEACKLLIHERDFYELASAYFERAARDCVRHAEISFDLQSHVRRGVEVEAVVAGIHRACVDAKKHLRISALPILNFQRHYGAQAAAKTLQSVLPYKHMIAAVGLDSFDAGEAPAQFESVFDAARAEGFFTVAHAVEEGAQHHASDLLQCLKVARIDDGICCLNDPKVVDCLVFTSKGLTLCPLASLKLRAIKSLKGLAFKQLLERGVCLTVNSDYPAFVGGYLNDNLVIIQRTLNLTLDEVKQLVKNSFRASFQSNTEKEECIAEVEAYCSRHEGTSLK